MEEDNEASRQDASRKIGISGRTYCQTHFEQMLLILRNVRDT